MDKKELRAISTIIWKRIIIENRQMYQNTDLELKTYAISNFDIEKSIDMKEDLNFINELNMNKYIKTDLNAFLSAIIYIRQFKSELLKRIQSKDNSLPFWLPTILMYFTYLEGIEFKKEFLKVNGLSDNDLEILTNSYIDSLFAIQLNELYRSENIELTQRM